jgi:hypothetical protein
MNIETKININYTVTVSNRFRRAVNAWYGKVGLATNRQIVNWFKMYGESNSDAVMEHLEIIELERKNNGYRGNKK